MKLANLLPMVTERMASLDRKKVIEFRERTRATGDYKDFNVLFAHCLLCGVTTPKERCEWYEKYDCTDKHITTMVIKACKNLGYLE